MQQPTSAGFHLSPQQKLMWGAAPLERAHLEISINGHLDEARLHNAMERIVQRHEILRTTYSSSAGMTTAFQVVGPNAPAGFDHHLESTSAGGHVLTLDLSAMNADAASLRLLFQELATAYEGRELEQALQYADYSEWQNEALQNAEGIEFWAGRPTSDPGPSLLLPFEKKASGASREVAGPWTVGSGGDEDTVLAAWQILLWRLTGRAEVTVGRVFDGRSQAEFTGALGLYETVIPEHASFETEVRFAEVIARAKASRSAAQEWIESVPMAEAGSLPVGFRVEEQGAPIVAAGVTFSLLAAKTYSPFALELRWSPDGRAAIAYDPARYERQDVETLGRRLQMIVTGDPQELAGKLPLLDAEERHRMVVDWNATRAAYPANQCIHQIFAEQADKTPASIALRDKTTRFTYEELNARANQVAHLLRKHGVGENIPVALMMERSAGMIVGLLGILKAGGCYVPLVPDHPKARLAHQLSETGAKAVVTEAKLVPVLPDFSGQVICLDRDAALIGQEPTTDPQANVTPEDLVYVIYTSGSTGTPKGVAVRHRNLVNYSWFIKERLQSPSLHFATVSTLAADLGNTSIFPSLVSGGCLHVIDFETAMSGQLFAHYAAANPFDVLKITPSHLTMLINSGGDGVLPRRFLISGGEALSWELRGRIQAAGCTVINHYGPTEATVGCCTFDGPVTASATVPIGKPIANDEVYILDSYLQPVPPGVAGELCIGGAGIAQGYLHQPDQTAEKFVNHPFSGAAGDRIYRTGDLARFLRTGDVEFLGRIDHQVKIRGFRVEPAEIEAALRQHPEVQEAIVATSVAPGSEGDKVLVAYITGATNVDWRSFLKERLPEYMFPSSFVHVNALPLTANGKVDLRALAELGAAVSGEREFAKPRNADEEKMAAIWREILKSDQVGIDDNFFERGGHSLLATQIIARIRNAFGVQFPLHSFLENPTIAVVTAKLTDFPKVESEEDAMARLLQEMDGISEEEAQMLLAAMDETRER